MNVIKTIFKYLANQDKKIFKMVFLFNNSNIYLN